MTQPVRVLVVEDSLVVRTYIELLLADEDSLQLVAAVPDGESALEFAQQGKADIVLMDLQLPGIDGLETTRRIMACPHPVPIVVLSGELRRSDVDMTFEALQAGAVDVMAKPDGLDAMTQQAFRTELTRTLRLMSAAKVTRRWNRSNATTVQPIAAATRPVSAADAANARVLAIGASTGGPPVVYKILATTNGRPFRVPVLISQHIVPGFDDGYIQWLAGTGHTVQKAVDGDKLQAGIVYVSPADASLTVATDGCVHIVPKAESELAPNVDRLFHSIAAAYGNAACGVILTGMGNDGAAGLLSLYNAGAMTVAQDEASCIVFGMPGEAIKAGAARQISTIDDICDFLARTYS